MFTGQHPAVMSCCIGEQHLHVLEEWEAVRTFGKLTSIVFLYFSRLCSLMWELGANSSAISLLAGWLTDISLL